MIISSKALAVGDEGIENLLYEVIGYSLSKTAKLNKAFIFKGNGRNGKSKIFRILEALLKIENSESIYEQQISHEHLEQLSGSKAGAKSTIKQLEGCTVNIAEDQKQPKYINNSMITRVISGEPISIQEKKDENYELIPYATMLFSVNEVINFKEIGLHITDRFVVIPFNATFTDDNKNRDINIGEKLCQPLALQIIATKSIQAFDNVLKNGKFTIPESVEAETNKYFNECCNVREFCELYPIETFMTKARYYEEYCEWCKLNNKEPLSNSQFGMNVLSLGYIADRFSFGNNRKNYYISPNFNKDENQEIYDEYLKYTGMSEEYDIAHSDDCKKKSYIITFDDYLCKYLYHKLDDVNGDYAKKFMEKCKKAKSKVNDKTNVA